MRRGAAAPFGDIPGFGSLAIAARWPRMAQAVPRATPAFEMEKLEAGTSVHDPPGSPKRLGQVCRKFAELVLLDLAGGAEGQAVEHDHPVRDRPLGDASGVERKDVIG